MSIVEDRRFLIALTAICALAAAACSGAGAHHAASRAYGADKALPFDPAIRQDTANLPLFFPILRYSQPVLPRTLL
jgi:hypothetical protein